MSLHPQYPADAGIPPTTTTVSITVTRTGHEPVVYETPYLEHASIWYEGFWRGIRTGVNVRPPLPPAPVPVPLPPEPPTKPPRRRSTRKTAA